jgi:hypothetical protein
VKPAALVGLLLAACSGEPRAGKLVSAPSAPDATASTVGLEALTVEEPRRLGKGHAMAWTEGTIAIADGPDMVLVDETTLVERERIAATSWTAPPQGKAVDPNDVRVPNGHVIAAALSPDGTRSTRLRLRRPS